MSTTFMLLLAGAAFALLGLGRLLRSQVLQYLAGGAAFLGIAALGRWLVLTLQPGAHWERWADVAVLLALGYLLARLALLAVFDWLLAQRMHVVVPRLARDVVALLLYVVVVATVLRYGLDMNVGGLLAGTAVITVVLGFALQETLGALLAGLALTWEQRFEAGSWVEVDGVVGEVEQLGWRSLVLRTGSGEHVLIPNSQVARARARLYGDGRDAVAVPVRLGVAYGAPPHAVAEVLKRVAGDVPLVLGQPASQVLVREFADNAVSYEVRMWTHEPWRAADLTDVFLTRAHAALAREGMEIPLPQRSVHLVATKPAKDPVRMSHDALTSSALFAGLPDDALGRLAATARWQEFAPGEAVVREGEASIALYLVARGEAVVLHAGQEVARVGEGEVFGEMAFLSGAPRAATVRSVGALAAVEVDSRALTALLAERRSLAEELANRMASRLQELATREALAVVPVPPRGLASYLLERLLWFVGG